jgi:4-alpha-glucanotransferase
VRDAARRAGVLLHPTSLPGPFGQGDFGPAAIAFLNWLERAGATVWQVLPLGPCGFAGSPYAAASAFAGNRYLISAEELAQNGWLDLSTAPPLPESGDSEQARWKDAVLRSAWEAFRSRATPEDRVDLDRFRTSQTHWLDDWALYSSLAQRFPGKSWTRWPAALAGREPAALEAARRELTNEIEHECFVQFVFFRQWQGLRRIAAGKGILVLGDLPIYVDAAGADVWANRDLFDLAPDGSPAAVSGVPPDYFSETGQRWGSPLYRWDRLEQDGFRWWIARFRSNLDLADEVRIDHFRGFAACWAIPASEPTAVRGHWRPGPGRKLFDAASRDLGPLPFVAEDLGVITPDVEELRDSLGLPGMRVLQFGFSSDDSPHLPHRHVRRAVVYTGTHDNDTARGWFESAGAEERQRAREYLGADGGEIHWDMIRAALESVADTAIAPFPDVLGLGSEARLNTPGRSAGNWRWRAGSEDFRPELADRFRRLSALTGRAAR